MKSHFLVVSTIIVGTFALVPIPLEPQQACFTHFGECLRYCPGERIPDVEGIESSCITNTAGYQFCKFFHCPPSRCRHRKKDLYGKCYYCPGTCIDGGRIHKNGQAFLSFDMVNSCFCGQGNSKHCTKNPVDQYSYCNHARPGTDGDAGAVVVVERNEPKIEIEPNVVAVVQAPTPPPPQPNVVAVVQPPRPPPPKPNVVAVVQPPRPPPQQSVVAVVQQPQPPPQQNVVAVVHPPPRPPQQTKVLSFFPQPTPPRPAPRVAHVPAPTAPAAGQQFANVPAPTAPAAGQQYAHVPAPTAPAAGQQYAHVPAPTAPAAGQKTAFVPAPTHSPYVPPGVAYVHPPTHPPPYYQQYNPPPRMVPHPNFQAKSPKSNLNQRTNSRPYQQSFNYNQNPQGGWNNYYQNQQYRGPPANQFNNANPFFFWKFMMANSKSKKEVEL